MSSWKDKAKLPASFRGVKFWVEAADTTVGRQSAQHIYPFREKDPAFREDMGKRPRTYVIEGFVAGKDYLLEKEALISAFETPGPGELVHPLYGTKRVSIAGDVHIRENLTTEGGIARFQVEFDPSEARSPSPASVVDAPAKLRTSADAAKAAIGADFLASYAPGTLLDSVTGALRSASSKMTAVLGRVQMETQALARLKRQVSELSSNAVALANEPADLLAEQMEMFEALADGLVESVSALDVVSPIAAVLSLYDFDPGVRPPETTPTRIQERANFDAAQRLTQRLAVVQAAVIAIELSFESFEDAVAARESITALLDEQSEIVADDVYPALQQLRADLVNAIPGAELDRRHLVAHTPTVTVPSLVLAHRLYGDVSMEDDIVKRNRVANPLFVIGGVALEVLTK